MKNWKNWRELSGVTSRTYVKRLERALEIETCELMLAACEARPEHREGVNRLRHQLDEWKRRRTR